MSLSRKVIILNKVDSPDIAQAIFILKNDQVDEFSAVTEAERIIREYAFCPREKKRRCPRALLFLSLFAIGAVVLFFTMF